MGRYLLAEFYCGYTRNVAASAAKGELDIYDGFFLADHCIQLLGAVYVVRAQRRRRFSSASRRRRWATAGLRVRRAG